MTLYFAPDLSSANAVIITRVSEELARRGNEITVVAAFPHYAMNTVDGRYRGRLIQREDQNGVRIIRTYAYTSPNKNSILVRVLNYVSFNVLSTLAALFSGPQDVILAPSPPITIGLSAWIVGTLKRIPYVYNAQDIYPDVAIKLGALRNPLLIALSRRLERFVYARARKVTVLSEGFRANLLAKGVPKSKLALIPNFVDSDFIRPLPRDNDFRRRFGLGDRLVVLYAGNMGHSMGLERIVDCAARFADRPEVLFLFVGNGSRRPAVEAYARERGVANVRFLPYQPREDVPELYAAADVCLIHLKLGIARDSVPSKAYTIMAAGRPTVAAVDRDSDTWTLIQDAHCGLCVEPEDPAALASAVETLLADPARRARLGENGRAHVVAHYTPEAVGRQYHELLTSIVERRQRQPSI